MKTDQHLEKDEQQHSAGQENVLAEIAEYWNEHIHDLEIATHPIGTPGFFAELDEYRFDKLRYLPEIVDFESYRGKRLLEVGCGVGIDLVRFALAGAHVTGVDLSPTAINLARKNFVHNAIPAQLMVMDGESLIFSDNQFDAVYAHGVLQYTANPQLMIHEIHRVLRPGGEAILMVYNKYSWLSVLSSITFVDLEHDDAPVFQTFSVREFRRLLAPFAHVRVITERFPVRTRLHKGIKANIYNGLFVNLFSLLPKPVIGPLGWHILAFAKKR